MSDQFPTRNYDYLDDADAKAELAKADARIAELESGTAKSDLKPIRIHYNDGDFYVPDCERIVRILAERGYACSIDVARILWELHSETWEAGWLGLDEDDAKVFEKIEPHFVVDE